MSAPAPNRPYSDQVLDHLRRPRGAGSLRRSDPDVRTGEAGDSEDGRLVRMQLRVEASGAILEARFKAFGCAATIAAASWLTGSLEGRSCSDAACIEAAEIGRALALAADQAPAAELALQALRAALAAQPEV